MQARTPTWCQRSGLLLPNTLERAPVHGADCAAVPNPRSRRGAEWRRAPQVVEGIASQQRVSMSQCLRFEWYARAVCGQVFDLSLSHVLAVGA